MKCNAAMISVRLFFLLIVLAVLTMSQASAATYSLTPNSTPISIPGNTPAALCSGNQGSWSGNTYRCDWNQPFSLQQGDVIISSVPVTIHSNNGVNLTNVTLGSSSTPITLTAESGRTIQLNNSVLYSTIGGGSTQNVVLTNNTTVHGSISVSGTIQSTNSTVMGTITSSNGPVIFTGGQAFGHINVQCCKVTVSGGAVIHAGIRAGNNGIDISNSTVTGDLNAGDNEIILTNVTMLSGNISAGSNNVTINGGDITANVTNSNRVFINNGAVVHGNLQARYLVEASNSTIYGDIETTDNFPEGLHHVKLTDSTVYGNVTVRDDWGTIIGNWPNSAIYGDCDYKSVTPSLCRAPAAHWKFDEAQWNNSANEVLDSSTNQRHGRARNGAVTATNSPSPASCTFGDFQSGSSSNYSYVDIGRNSFFHDADNFSFSLWLKMNGADQSGNRQVILAYGADNGVNDDDDGRFELLRTSGGALRFAVRMQNEDLRYVEATGNVFNGQWHHVAVSYSKTERRMRLYVDNTLVDNSPNQTIGDSDDAKTPNDGDEGLSIGALPDGSRGIKGQIDEVRFLNFELTAAEVATYAAETASCASAAPVLSWNLNVSAWTGAASEVLDSSGNSLNGRTFNSLLSSISAPAHTGDPGTCAFSQFNGSNQYIAVADNAKLDITDELTVAIWVRPRAYPGSDLMTILSKDTNYEFHLTPAGKIYWWWHDQDGVERTLTSNGSIQLNQWTHVAITYKNGAQRIYINGSTDINTGSYTKKLATNNLALEVGRDNAANRYFNGDLDEVRIYARAHNQTKIEEIRQERNSCSLIASCLLTEEFNDYTQWYRTVLSGTAPDVVNGRLQLTNSATYQSTAITFKQGFPTAGNKLTVEFDHFAYGGNGADGVGLVLSDASVTPAPGSFGGSLGYAPRNTTNPAQSGFAGGWLGIGFDEFGNYAKATEGRSGGVTNNIDSSQAIGVRGAGSGTTGYSWLGWSTKLSRSLSISGSTPGRGDRFRITLDTATNASQVAFRLERREAGGSTFTEVLNSSNVNLANQPSMPVNFLLSFTGSTGANTNFHAIDNVQVCSFKAPVPVPIGEASIHHFELSYDPSGLTCASSNVTVKACANEACTSLYTGEVTVNLAANNGGSWGAGDSVTFTGGQTTKALTKTISGATVLSVSSSSVGASNNPRCYEGGALDAACSMNFLDTGLRFSSIPNQVAGLVSPSQVQLQVVQTNTQTGACVARVTPTSTVQFGYQCVDPVSCIAGQTFKIDNTTIVSNPASAMSQYSDVVRSFDSNAATNFNINYSDVGKVKLYAKLALPALGTQPAITLEQQSNEFVVRPDRVLVSSVSAATGTANPATKESGAGFVAAGEEFKIVLDVVNRLGDKTPNFGREINPEAVAISSSLAYPLINGAACDSGTTNCNSNPSVTFSSASAFSAVSGIGGRFENTTAKWLQVGSLNINGKLDDQNYLGSGDTASSNPSVVVGRFYPHHFRQSSAAADDSCQAGNFSYMGSASISTNVVVEAIAVDGSTVLTNYNSLVNKTYADTANIGLVAENANAGIDLSSRLGTVSAPWKDGRWTFNSTTMNFAKLTTLVPDGPYSALQLGLTVRSELDSRNFTSTALNMDAITNTDCIAAGNCKAVQVGSPLDVRYGRLALLNAGGPEDQNLPITLQSQYWSGNRFERNLNDSCTSYAATNLNVTGITTAKGGSSGSMVTGQNPFLGIFIPAPGAPGTATMQYQIPPALNYLQFPWNGGTVLANPVAEAQFGRYQGNKRQIFWQERLN